MCLHQQSNYNSNLARHLIVAITITHAYMKKANCSSGSNAKVYSFIPVNQLPCDAAHKHDAFFEPLIEEMENLFIHGEEVFFKVEGFSPPNNLPTVRLLLLVTADSKSHAEIGLIQLEDIEDAGVAMCPAHILRKEVIIITGISVIDFEILLRNAPSKLIGGMITNQTKHHQ